jgi:hypothetical protein
LSSVFEILVGALYTLGTGFNSVYTLRHAEEFYTDFVEGAWFGPPRRLTRSVVVPNGVPFTLALIVFQMIVAVSILARGGAVTPALVAGGVFAAVVALFSSPGGAVGNLGLAALQLALGDPLIGVAERGQGPFRLRRPG